MATFRMRSSRAAISTSPLGTLAFTVSAERRSTVPRTATTNSLRSSLARAWTSLDTSGRNTHCTIPSRSRTSAKITPPWSRALCTQPVTTTSRPIDCARSAPQ